MNNVLKRIIDTGKVFDEQNNEIPIHSSISHDDGTFIQEIISKTKPNITLEVGLAYGISALYICDAVNDSNKQVHHIAIDPYQNSQWGGIGIKNLKMAGYNNIQLYQQQSSLVLPELETEGVKIDFAFIDGWHTFDHTLIDFFYIDKILNVGGIVVFDDVTWPAVKKVCRFITNNRSYSIYDCQSKYDDSIFNAKTKLGRILNRTLIKTKAWLNVSMAINDYMNGLIPGSDCIAFQKKKNDERNWDHYKNF